MECIYIIRTCIPKENLRLEETVEPHKGLSVVLRAFRSMKSMDPKVRAIFHHLGRRVRAYVFLCMLAYSVEWHMRRVLAPILFENKDAARAAKLRASVVRPAMRSEKAKKKVARKRTEEDLPVHSFLTLLKDLATITISWHTPKNPDPPFSNGRQPSSAYACNVPGKETAFVSVIQEIEGVTHFAARELRFRR